MKNLLRIIGFIFVFTGALFLGADHKDIVMVLFANLSAILSILLGTFIFLLGEECD